MAVLLKKSFQKVDSSIFRFDGFFFNEKELDVLNSHKQPKTEKDIDFSHWSCQLQDFKEIFLFAKSLGFIYWKLILAQGKNVKFNTLEAVEELNEWRYLK